MEAAITVEAMRNIKKGQKQQKPAQDSVIPADPHHDVRAVRVDRRTVIYVPRHFNEQQTAEYVRRWCERLNRCRNNNWQTVE
jgi:hypothetical protein